MTNFFPSPTGPRSVRLTPREVQILSLVAQGLGNQEVADELGVSRRTVDSHLAQAYGKLEATNRIQAIRTATRLGIMPGEPSVASLFAA